MDRILVFCLLGAAALLCNKRSCPPAPKVNDNLYHNDIAFSRVRAIALTGQVTVPVNDERVSGVQ